MARDIPNSKSQDVHKTLEVEIHKEEIPILITSEEEKWALTSVLFLIMNIIYFLNYAAQST